MPGRSVPVGVPLTWQNEDFAIAANPPGEQAASRSWPAAPSSELLVPANHQNVRLGSAQPRILAVALPNQVGECVYSARAQNIPPPSDRQLAGFPSVLPGLAKRTRSVQRYDDPGDAEARQYYSKCRAMQVTRILSQRAYQPWPCNSCCFRRYCYCSSRLR